MFTSGMGAHLFVADRSRIYDLPEGLADAPGEELVRALGLDDQPRRIDDRPLAPPPLSASPRRPPVLECLVAFWLTLLHREVRGRPNAGRDEQLRCLRHRDRALCDRLEPARHPRRPTPRSGRDPHSRSYTPARPGRPGAAGAAGPRATRDHRHPRSVARPDQRAVPGRARHGPVTPVHRRVYEITRTIAPGTTLSYGEVADRLGAPGSARAVGQALGRNPFAIVVPCHRVVTAAGTIGGFSAHGGVATKLRLLRLEYPQIIGVPSLFDPEMGSPPTPAPPSMVTEPD